MAEQHSTTTYHTFQDLTGKRFGRWLVLEHAGHDKHGAHCWFCLCDCGNDRVIQGSQLRTGHSKSCGCLKNEMTSKRSATHKKCHLSEYSAYVNMHTRCYNTASPVYKNYGARGIYVCERWKRNFVAFYEDMGRKPSPDMTLDRIDNDGPYSRDNCKWRSRKQQNRNTRQNRLITFRGDTRCVAEWLEAYDINRKTLMSRLERGWSVEDALTRPVQHQRRIPK